jgi:hypothetical protein
VELGHQEKIDGLVCAVFAHARRLVLWKDIEGTNASPNFPMFVLKRGQVAGADRVKPDFVRPAGDFLHVLSRQLAVVAIGLRDIEPDGTTRFPRLPVAVPWHCSLVLVL